MTETITTIRLEDVHPHPKHYREVKPADVKALAANIAVVGQLDPIRVWCDGDIYIVDAGHHRVEAMRLLGLETIDAIIEDQANDAALVASNMHFAETELERSRGTQLLLATGVRPVDAAALTGESQDKVSKAQAGIRIVADEVACEDLTLDRLAAIADFEDDPDAVKRLENAHEAKWRSVHDELLRMRRTAEGAEQAKAIVAAAGCEILVTMVPGPGFRYLSRSNDAAPEGATHARIQLFGGSGSFDIIWYVAVDPATVAEEEAAANARREQAELIAAEFERAQVRRREFILDYLSPESVSHSNVLRDFAVKCWECAEDTDGVPAESRVLDGVVLVPTLPRFYASVLFAIDAAADMLMRHPSQYYLDRHGWATLDYLDALNACGFEPTDVENGAIAELEEALDGARERGEDG